MHVCMHETNLKIGLNRVKSFGMQCPLSSLNVPLSIEIVETLEVCNKITSILEIQS